MKPLGKNQLAALKSLGPNMACIVGGKEHFSLLKRGLVEALDQDGDSMFMFVITPDGLRALADAIDGGKLPRMTIDDFKPPASHKGE
jgi:hypothetical protein